MQVYELWIAEEDQVYECLVATKMKFAGLDVVEEPLQEMAWMESRALETEQVWWG